MPSTPSGPFPSRDSGEAAGRRHPWLTPGVAGVGAASMFSDAGHEMTTAMLPAFLTSTLHASAGGTLLASSIAGVLYAAISPVVAFCYVAGWMVLSLVATTLVPSEQGAS